MAGDPVVAIGLLTQRDLERFGHSLRGVIPLPADGSFDALLKQLDTVEVEPPATGMALRSTTRQD